MRAALHEVPVLGGGGRQQVQQVLAHRLVASGAEPAHDLGGGDMQAAGLHFFRVAKRGVVERIGEAGLALLLVAVSEDGAVGG